MSSVSIQKHLPCHDYHMGSCVLPKGKCPYSHVGTSWGICPNKNYCPTPHKFVDCPLFLRNSCPKQETCSYRHKKPEVVKQEEEEKKMEIETEQEVTFALENKDQQQDNEKINQISVNALLNSSEAINNKQIIKGLTIEDFKSSLVELNQDLKILLPLIDREKEQAQKWNTSCSLDLCFIVDITGSMSPWLNQVVQYVGNTLNTIYQDFPAIDLRVAFSGYRDHCDTNKYVEYDFTRNVEDYRQQINKITCNGGGDAAEDVTGGLYNALQFEWGCAARQIVFIADSPAHGLKYHAGVSDDHPNGCPSGRKIEDLMKDFSQKRIDFTCIEINSTTKKMFDVMQQSYGTSLVVKDLKSSGSSAINGPSSLANVVHEQIKSTVTASLSKSGIGSGAGGVKPQGQFGSAIQAIMENKKFKRNFSWTKSREKSSKMASTISGVQIEEQKVLEEDEYDSDDSEYEAKLQDTCQKQYKKDLDEKATRTRRAQEEKIANLRKLFPSQYFETVEESQTRNQKKIKEKFQKVQYEVAPFDWENFSNSQDYQAICYSFELVKNYKGNQEINWKNLEIKSFYLGTKVRINNMVFSEGAMRYAYRAKDLYLKQKMVAKQYKKLEKQQKMTVQEMERDIVSQIVCKYIVKEFNSMIVEVQQEDSLILQFIDCYIYETTYPYNANCRFYFEKYIEGTYEKFNNNAGYVSQTDNPYSPLAQALSHFSWQLSKGYLAIVDLQGNDTGILTDPQIHCLDSDKFGDGNLGYEGILRFFSTHQCNEYCRMLQLIHPLDTSQIPHNNTFFFDYGYSQNNNTINDSQARMSQMCDICQSPESFLIQKIIDSKKNNSRLTCSFCLDQIEKTTFQKKCAQCPSLITFSTYECIQLRRDAPPLCTSCNSKHV